MESARPVSNTAPNAKEHTMSLDLHDLHKSAGIDDDRTCLPKSTLSSLRDERTPSFGRWLGQINGQD
ncbi:hypothetical protein BIU97_02735 [Curtobacterium sp. MCBA15_009]|nr:hypothetical protein BIU92_06625 [Curtobacterium sp. MCBA15_003]OII12870.1 hypothetical protein BIU97_02735 [Curtobacterium sp. MCBA15_009]OII32185.1 hypothetical protein BIU94_02170 [Curtobacterium sp. MMLR14_006]